MVDQILNLVQEGSSGPIAILVIVFVAMMAMRGPKG